MSSHPMLEKWASELAQRLGRPEIEIRDKGLSAGDFSPTQSIEIQYPDGSRMEFRYAFIVISKERKLAALFTEHCGYLEVPLLPDMEIIHSQRDVFLYESDE
jgi:hypothetical protein